MNFTFSHKVLNVFRGYINPYVGRWKQLPEKDRLALVLLGIFLGGLILVYGILQPSYRYHKKAREQFVADTELLSWLESRRPVVESLKNTEDVTDNKPSISPLSLVTQTAKKHELNVKRVQPDGEDKLRVWLEGVSADKALVWMNELQDQSLEVDDASLERVEGRSGVVDLRIVFISK